jgi:hypothetical protein
MAKPPGILSVSNVYRQATQPPLISVYGDDKPKPKPNPVKKDSTIQVRTEYYNPRRAGKRSGGVTIPPVSRDIIAGSRLSVPAGDVSVFSVNGGRVGPYQGGTRLRCKLQTVPGAVGNFTRFKFSLGNWRINAGGTGEADTPGSNITFKASLLPLFGSAAAPTQVTWSAATSITLTNGQTVFSDWITLDAAPGTDMEIRLWYSWDAAGAIYASHSRPAVLTEGWDNNLTVTDRTMVASATPGYGTGDGFQVAPISLIGSIVATAAPPTVMVIGDSLTRNTQDVVGAGSVVIGDANGSTGWIERILTGNYGYFNVSMSGASMTSFNTKSTGVIAANAATATHAVCSLGVNDPLTTLGQFQAAAAAMWATCRANGLKPIQTTITTSASSTDGYTTLANQTSSGGKFAAGAAIQQFNAWLLAGAGGNANLHGVLDVAASVVDIPTAKWRVDRGVIVDIANAPLHLNVLGHTLVASDMAAPLAALLAL